MFQERLNLAKTPVEAKVAYLTICLSLLCLLNFSICLGQEAVKVKNTSTKNIGGKESPTTDSTIFDIAFNAANKEVINPVLESNYSFSFTATPSGNAISAIFNNFSISLQKSWDPLTATIMTGLRIPVTISKNKKSIKYSQELRGSIDKDEGSRIVFILDLAGKTVVTEFPYGKKYSNSIFRSFPLKAKDLRLNSYLATFTIFVERRTPMNVAHIDFDSFDVGMTINTSKKNKNKTQ